MSLRVLKKFDSIKQYKKELDSYNVKSVNDLQNNSQVFYSSSMLLFSMVNDLISISEEVIDILDLELPENYHSIFKSLRKGKVISSEEEIKCNKLVTLRNTIAHEYEELDEKHVFDLLQMSVYILEIANELMKNIKK